jgi:hypothetical protein
MMSAPAPLATAESTSLLTARWAINLMIVACLTIQVARIATVKATTGESPMLSANDRSRWCTVRALVDQGTYAIDSSVVIKHPETKRRYWKSIDMVRHRGPDGREHYYSSKPPLFPTLVAGQYWLIRNLTGATLDDHPFQVMRLILVITNVLPMAIFWMVLQRCVWRLGVSPSAALFTMTAAIWGTLLTTFAVTLNNHLPGAISVLLATACLLTISYGKETKDRSMPGTLFAAAGFCAAFGVANELPALAFFACAALAAWYLSPRLTLLAFLPAALLVAIAFCLTNYLAHGTWVPAYGHRSDGPVVARVPLDAAMAELEHQTVPVGVREALARVGPPLSPQAVIKVRQDGTRWTLWDRSDARRFALVAAGADLEIRRWDNWYDYEGSYWTGPRQGVDRGEPLMVRYAFHAMLGHHGVFSLTPLWVLSIWGVWVLWERPRPAERALAAMTACVTVVCVAFYLSRPLIDRNYGGVSCGFRWVIWMIPLWLLCLAPAADRLLHTRTGRVVAMILLAVSIFSATYSWANPWTHPWIWQWGDFVGWWD